MEAYGRQRKVKKVLLALLLFLSLFVGCTMEMEATVSSPVASATQGVYEEQIVIEWNSVSGVSTYEIYRSSINSNDFAEDYYSLGEVKATRYVDSDLQLAPGKTYYYKVRSVKGETKSLPRTNPAIGWLDIPTLQNVEVTKGDFLDKIGISWDVSDRLKTAAEQGVIGNAEIYYSTDPSNVTDEKITVPLSELKNSEGTEISDNIVRGLVYYFKTKIVVIDEGEKSSDLTALDSGWTAIESPEKVVASKGEYKDRIRIEWDEVHGIGYYNIYVKEVGDNSYPANSLASLAKGSDEFEQRVYYWYGAEMAKNYRFKVTCVKDNEETGDNSGAEYKNLEGQYYNLGYTRYSSPDIDQITQDSASYVQLKVVTDEPPEEDEDLMVQVYRRELNSESLVKLSDVVGAVSEEGGKGKVTLEDRGEDGLIPGKKYYYSATVYSEQEGEVIGESEYSSEKAGWIALTHLAV